MAKKLNVGKLVVDEYSTEECVWLVSTLLDTIIQNQELGLKDHNMGYVGQAATTTLMAKSILSELSKKLGSSQDTPTVL